MANAKNKNIEAIYPLSPMQQGMLFHTIYNPQSGAYFEQFSCRLTGVFNRDAFSKAWHEVVRRHPALRTSFVWKKLNKMLQVVHKEVELPIAEEDWTALSEQAQAEKFEQFLIDDKKKGFNLSKAPLMRFHLIKRSEQDFYFLWSFHHLLTDGWSMPLILKEVFTLYEMTTHGFPAQLPAARPYRDYINWLQKQDMEKARAHWQALLGDFSQPTPLTRTLTDPLAVQLQERQYKMQQIEIDQTVFDKLQNLARQNQLTMNTIVQSAWAYLLSRYSGENDVLFGATVSGRPPELPGVENIVGLFINTLPMLVSVDPAATVTDYLKDIQAQAVAMREFEYTPLVEIQGWSAVPRDLPLFESIVVFENYPVDSSMKEQKLSFKISDVRSKEETNYPVTLVAAAHQTLVLEFAYESPLFEDAVIRSMLLHLQNVLTAVAEDAQRSLASIPLITAEEQRITIEDWNRTQKDFPGSLCVHQLFEEHVKKQPAAKALQLGEETLSYAELNARANRLARYLRKKGVKPETTVAIYLERSFDMIVALLAVMKAGGAYVPLDPTYPAERLSYIMTDSRAALVITQDDLQANVQAFDTPVLNIRQEQPAIEQESSGNLKNLTSPQNLAYMIYTSGSTGRPKGTLLQHYGAINTAQALGKEFKVFPGGSMLQFASLGFDASVAEIFSALLNGASLHLIGREDMLSETKLPRIIRDQKIHTIILPPSVLAILSHENLPDLKVVGSAGEACSKEIVQRWAPGRLFVNGYGPTEATVSATINPIENQKVFAQNISIGAPMDNVQVYILDEQLNPLPVGVPGELHIAGVGLARGYLGRPDLTAEKFIPNPFSAEAGARMYKSGDLARWLSDGKLEFLGRIDFQVKIRGFRIELGEIEAALKAYPDVRDAVVIAREDIPGNKYLAAYFIPEEDPQISAMQNYLKEKLPDYMVPAVFIALEKFPLTSSGKVNRKALPIPQESDQTLSAEFIAPRNPTEELLAVIWKEILKRDAIGVTDNFFDLGGHSLMATQVTSRIREAFGVELPLQDLFETPHISDLALKIEQLQMAEEALKLPPLQKAPREGHPPLSFAQQRLWFLDQLAPGSANYNIPSAIRLQGNLNLNVLQRSIKTIVERHEALRTVFQEQDGAPVQIIQDTINVPLPIKDLSALPKEEQETQALALATAEAAKPFDLAKGPLVRIRLLKLSEQEHIALFTLHHTVTDGWSMGILVKEIAALYNAYLVDEPSPLPELPVQYADYAVWQRNYLQGEVLEKQLAFWKELIGENPPALELPLDHPRPAMQTFNGSTINETLPAELTKQLVSFSQKENVTLFMTLLAAFQTLMHRYNSQEQILVGSPIANRTRVETEGLIGFFVNTLVLKADFSQAADFKSLLKQIRQMTLQVYAHQDLPFEQLVEALQPQRDMSHSPLFQVAFILQNAPLDKIELPDLTILPFQAENKSSKYDLTLNVAETEDGLALSLEYNTDLFEQTTAQRTLQHYRNLLNAVLENPKEKIAYLDYISAEEKQRALFDWNQTQTPFEKEAVVQQIFEALAEEHPDTPALQFGQQILTYGQLNERANQLAHYLIATGLQNDEIVGISMPRSLDVPVAMLAILKAGGAFLSIDPTYPQERIAYMIEDSGLKYVITHKSLSETLPLNGKPVLCLDSDNEKIAAQPKNNPPLRANHKNLAYIIYTSGSTGKPKGTMLGHSGLINLSRAQRQAFKITSDSRILQFAPLSFDASVWETVMALLNGATLVLADQETLTTGQGITETLKNQHVSTVTLPPSVLAVLPEEELPDLRTIVTAGEKCTSDLVQRWGKGRQFVNAYGPTETTVCASMYEANPADRREPPIGKPINNFQLYVLDAHSQPVPVGVPGELCIGGAGLARGYLKRPDLTAEKFVPNPFATEPGSRLYRSGDLVRWLPDGNLDFMGRIDMQVKVRGFRIELGEIEAVLTALNSVLDAAVVAKADKNGELRLVAFYVTENKEPLSANELRSALQQQLPDYMIPSIFMHLPEMPLSPSGKVDRKALPEAELSRDDLKTEYVAPRNDQEEKLSAIVRELLNIEKVGVYDNFFELGGHSLLATQFISNIRKEFNVDIPLRKLFETPTVAGLAEAILNPETALSAEDEQGIEQLERGSEDIDGLLAELEGLSDEEARLLLEADPDSENEDRESNE